MRRFLMVGIAAIGAAWLALQANPTIALVAPIVLIGEAGILLSLVMWGVDCALWARNRIQKRK